ncbi:MAG: transketolase, partial [Elusimicrobia bacterium]|nr:transketolase [Elusimicrobiota bacterium]
MRKVFQAHNLFKENKKTPTPEALSAAIRINALSAIVAAQHGWLGATFSCTDILTFLYFFKMNFDYQGKRPEGDILILSKGHAAPAQYACLAEHGVISYEDLKKYKTPEGPQAHTDILTPGIPSNTGSLGQSLSKAAGIALADRIQNKKRKIFLILGDGELQEGQNYEALMTIAKFNLTEIIPIIDRNRLQTDSPMEAIIGEFNIPKVLSSFG